MIEVGWCVVTKQSRRCCCCCSTRRNSSLRRSVGRTAMHLTFPRTPQIHQREDPRGLRTRQLDRPTMFVRLYRLPPQFGCTRDAADAWWNNKMSPTQPRRGELFFSEWPSESCIRCLQSAHVSYRIPSVSPSVRASCLQALSRPLQYIIAPNFSTIYIFRKS